MTDIQTKSQPVNSGVDASKLRSVAPSYQHHQRLVTPGEGFNVGSASLKWKLTMSLDS